MLVKKITVEWLEKMGARSRDIEWFKRQSKTDTIGVLKALVSDKKLNSAGWLIVRVMDRLEDLTGADLAPTWTDVFFDSAWDAMQFKILKYGLSLLEKENASAR